MDDDGSHDSDDSDSDSGPMQLERRSQALDRAAEEDEYVFWSYSASNYAKTLDPVFCFALLSAQSA